MRVDGFRVALGAPFPAAIAVLDFLLLRVTTGWPSLWNARTRRVGTAHPGLAAFQRLAIGLEAVPQIVEQPVHRALADAVALDRKTVRQPCGTVTPQRTLRIAARHRFKLALQRRHQTRIHIRHPLAPAAGATQTS